jgi:FtsP/CotA-like multicopper oxidase with cupredoxin domain
MKHLFTRFRATGPLWPLLGFLMIAAAFAMPARAAQMDCLPTQQALVKIPEIVTKGGVLRGTILLDDVQERVNFRTPPQSIPGSLAARTADSCFPQYVRAYHAGSVRAPLPGLADPLPGPTLRARVGDIIELAFINHIDPNDFGNSIDMDQKKGGTGCDEARGLYPTLITPATPGNPQTSVTFDKFPDCFHGSSTGNIHFHGTHTNPNTTGDNVLIEVRPSSPSIDGSDRVTAATVQKPFDAFFKTCESILGSDPLSEWPTTWTDLPQAFRDDQKARLMKYDAKFGQGLWDADEAALAKNGWPQYYIGAYPYCFHLPKYTAATWPPPGPANGRPVLQMGQSPGTQWYHAHKHGSTSINVSNGMSGVFIIEGDYDDALNKYYNKTPNWTRTQPVMLVNQIGGTPNMLHVNNGRTDKGADFSVNGRLQPKVHMYPGEVQMWRIVNSSPRSAMYLPYLPEGFQWRQLAQDGVQLAPDNYDQSLNQPLTIAAGNRVDILVKAPVTPHNPLSPVTMLPHVAHAELLTVPDATTIGFPAAPPPPVTLMWIEVSGRGPKMDLIPKDRIAPLPAYLANITDDEIKPGATKTIAFASGPPQTPSQHTINGKQFNEQDQSNWQTVQDVNTAEEWKIVNNTTFQPIDHPFHIHINPFQVVEVFDPNQTVVLPNGGPVAYKYVFAAGDLKDPTQQCLLDPSNQDSWKPCNTGAKPAHPVWWDVFPIPSGRSVFIPGQPNPVTVGGYFKMRTRFVDFPGIFVLHCHILAHEDRGMMTVVAVGVPRSALQLVHHH